MTVRKSCVNTSITAGKIQTGGGRAKPLIADYILVYKGRKLAVIEAKSEDKEVGEGVAQAKQYALMLHVDFAYAANGKEIYAINMKTGKEGLIASFPAPEELWKATFAEQNQWREAFNAVPFEDVGSTKDLRYYQEIAVNKTMDAIADGKERILLTTGHRDRQNLYRFPDCVEALSNPLEPEA